MMSLPPALRPLFHRSGLALHAPDKGAPDPGRHRAGYLPEILRLLCIVLCLMTGLISGCATAGPPPPAMLNAAVTAGAHVNPDPDGRPSPVVVEIFELSSLAAFKDASFDGLYASGKQTLGDSLLATHSLIVSPGGSKTLAISLTPRTAALGVIAGFAHLDGLQWRAAVQTMPGKDVRMAVAVDKAGVTIQPSR